MLRVILCRPGEAAEIVEIEDDLESMQELVGGLIEPYDPFYSETDPRYENVILVCNEEGKLLDLEPNRGLYDEDGRLLDIYCGTIVCIGARPEDEDFSSLTDTEIAVYMMMYGDLEYSVKAEEGADA